MIAKAGTVFGWIRAAAAAAALVLASGCASVPAGEVNDPFEGYNRAMYGFNDGLDRALLKPVATAYRDVMPEQVRERVRNFFANIGDFFIGINNLLQGKPADAGTDFARLLFNSTFGLLGIHDFASEIGLEKHNEDFGQTFGRWGFNEGPYFVWPVFGPNTIRDSVGQVLDMRLDPVSRYRPMDQRNVGIVLRVVQTRADLLEASRLLEEAALDRYVFQRDAYLQRRRSLVNDGVRLRRESTQEEAEPVPTAAATVTEGQQ